MPETIKDPLPPIEEMVPPFSYEFLTQPEIGGLEFLQNNPGIKVHLHFSSHDTKEAPGVEELFEQPIRTSDIVAVEGNKYDPIQEEYLQALARNNWFSKIVNLAPSGNGFEKRRAKAIKGSGTLPLIADVPKDHALADEKAAEAILFDQIIQQHGTSLSPNDAADTIHAAYADAREWVMLGELGAKVKELTITNPQVQDRLSGNDLKIFMSVGSYHTFVFHKLRKLGLSPTRSFPTKPHNLAPGLEGSRKQMSKIHRN